MHLTLPLLLVFAATFLFTALWLHVARRRNWFDYPNHRSSHVLPTPKSGGAGFVLVYSLYILWLYVSGQLALEQLWLIALGLLLVAMGFVDDLRSLGIWQRIGLQGFAVVLAVILLGPLPALVFPWGALEERWLQGLLVVAGLVWLINLYNFMDGIDALAAAEAVFFCLSLALLAGGADSVTLPCIGLAFAVSGFMYFNLPPARLFMGDLGSNYLGYMLGVLGLMSMQAGNVNTWTVLVLLGVFIVDATTTLIERMRTGAVWYHGHRSHAYQQAAKRLNNHGSVVLAVALLNVCWLLPMAWLTTVQENWGILITFVAWIFLYVLGNLVKRTPQSPATTSQAPT